MLKRKDNKIPLPDIQPVGDTTEEVVEENALAEMYQAVKRAILTIPENPNDPDSEPYFKTIAIDTGQFQRIVRSENIDTEVIFPAIFIHYTNVRYLTMQERIGQGRANMRIRFILNNINHHDPELECEPFYIFQRVNKAIQDAKYREPALRERCTLQYYDMPTTTNTLQAYWIDYEVWFKETSTWIYKDWVKRHVVIPPYTNHSDAPEYDIHGHGNHTRPTHKETSGFVPSVEEDNDPEEPE